MNKDILTYYHEELDYVRVAGAEFASLHPKIAGNLQMDQHGVEDPMVARLVESFAFMNAKLSKQLEDGYEHFANNLLNVLYPHINLPMPSVATIQIAPTDKLEQVTKVMKGTAVESVAEIDGAKVNCKFHTCYNMDVLPLQIMSAEYGQRNNSPLSKYLPAKSKSFIQMSIVKTSDKFSFAAQDINTLRIYINSNKQYASTIYAAIFHKVQSIVIYDAKNKSSTTLSTAQLQKVGFAVDENLIPYPANSFAGFRILTEYNSYADKFMYFDITGCAEILKSIDGDALQLFLCFADHLTEIPAAITKTTFQLNCTPIINLFNTTSEAVRVDHLASSYLLSMDKSISPWATECYQVSALSGFTEAGDTINLKPAYKNNYATSKKLANQDVVYWQAKRQPSWQFGSVNNNGSEMLLSFTADNLTLDNSEWTITADCWCTNRDLPLSLSYNGVGINYSIEHEQSAELNINSVRRPTATVRPKRDDGKYWQLIGALVGAQDNLTDPISGLDNLKNILQSFNLTKSEEWDLYIEQIQNITVTPTTIRYPDSQILTFVRGIKYSINFANNSLNLGDLYLFGTILNNFLNEYCALDSFILLEFTKEQHNETLSWKPKLGVQHLI
jgi:type VI secretion system protein ImpG